MGTIALFFTPFLMMGAVFHTGVGQGAAQDLVQGALHKSISQPGVVSESMASIESTFASL